jgi:glutathione S-transferase
MDVGPSPRQSPARNSKDAIMAIPIIYGPAYSTYTRTARLAFEEKPAEYRLEPVDILTGAAQQSSHLARQPFGKVPAFEHDGETIYETNAIVRYIDQVFPGQSLQPADPRRAARMNQVIGIIDAYGYGAIIGKLFWQRAIVPMQGGLPDEATIEQARPTVERCLVEFSRLKGNDAYLAGPQLSMADLYLAPVFAYLTMTPDAEALLRPHGGLQSWWQVMSSLPAMEKTRPNLG